jgi:hypothetical protein
MIYLRKEFNLIIRVTTFKIPTAALPGGMSK